jgi:hypothetical protein
MADDSYDHSPQPNTPGYTPSDRTGGRRKTWRRAVAALVLLLFGYWIYASFVFTDLEISIMNLALLLAVLIGSIASRRRVDRLAGVRLVVTGALLMQAYSAFRDFAVSNRWPAGQLRTVADILIGPRLAAFGCLVIGAIILFRTNQQTSPATDGTKF